MRMIQSRYNLITYASIGSEYLFHISSTIRAVHSLASLHNLLDKNRDCVGMPVESVICGNILSSTSLVEWYTIRSCFRKNSNVCRRARSSNSLISAHDISPTTNKPTYDVRYTRSADAPLLYVERLDACSDLQHMSGLERQPWLSDSPPREPRSCRGLCPRGQHI